MLSLKNIFVVLTLTISIVSYSQKLNISGQQEIYIDHLENIYITDKDNFSLISSNNIKEYQNSFLGEIHSVDVSNALRILIFYKEANQLIFLNNELSIIGDAISLDDLDAPDVSVACASQINGFWIFNNLNHRIEFYDSQLRKTHTSIDLFQYISSIEDIIEMQMRQENIYLFVKNTGILVFDMFASYIKTIPIKQAMSFQVLEKSILYTNRNQALVYDFEKLNHSVLFQGKKEIEFARVYNTTLFYVENKQLFRQELVGVAN